MMGVFSATASAIRKSLTRTRQALGRPIRHLVAGRELSDDLIAEIEAALITADVGVACTGAIIDELREAHRKGRIVEAEETLAFLKSRLRSRLQPGAAALSFAGTGPSVILVAGVNGSGKTTSVAKIAKALRDDGRQVVLAAA
ncbi:MAG: signal recognition particle receptor subunit alpha, partial [Planctomycetota bacterium]